MHVSKPRFLSLRWRLMGPLLGVWAMGLVLLVGILYASILERFRTLVDQRADVMVAAVYSAAETAREPADLRRFISTLGASRDVRLVTLLAGSPLRVVAASDHGLHGQPAEALDPSIAARLGEVLLSRQGWRSLDVAERRLDVLEPLLLVGSDGENGRLEDGVLQLRLDAGSLWQAAQDTVVQLSLWLGAVLSAVAGLFYLMVSRYVLRPAGAIRGVLARRRETGGDLPVPVMRRDELGELAEALNELLLTLRTRNRQLAAQSFGYALDGPADYGLSAPDLAIDWLPASPYAVFLHATSRANKMWPDASWIALGEHLRTCGVRIVLPWGNQAERDTAERLARALPNALLAPGMTLLHAAVMLSRATIVVGVDTGLAHLAVALQRPTVGIYITTRPELTGLHGGESAVNLGGGDEHVLDRLGATAQHHLVRIDETPQDRLGRGLGGTLFPDQLEDGEGCIGAEAVQ